MTDITAGASATIGYTGNNSPGTLTVGDGAHTATVALQGNYSLASFTPSSDGHGGTSIVDPPLMSLSVPAESFPKGGPQIALLNQYMASVFAPAVAIESAPPVTHEPERRGQDSFLTRTAPQPSQHG